MFCPDCKWYLSKRVLKGSDDIIRFVEAGKNLAETRALFFEAGLDSHQPRDRSDFTRIMAHLSHVMPRRSRPHYPLSMAEYRRTKRLIRYWWSFMPHEPNAYMNIQNGLQKWISWTRRWVRLFAKLPNAQEFAEDILDSLATMHRKLERRIAQQQRMVDEVAEEAVKLEAQGRTSGYVRF